MAIASKLSNGYIVLLLTPREATCLSDELLEPGDFPWQSTENQVTGFEIRKVLRNMVAEDAQIHVAEADQIARNLIEQHEEAG